MYLLQYKTGSKQLLQYIKKVCRLSCTETTQFFSRNKMLLMKFMNHAPYESFYLL